MIDLNEKQIIAFFKEKLIVSHNHEKLPIPSVKIFPETGSTNTDMKESLKKEGEASEGAEKSSARLSERNGNLFFYFDQTEGKLGKCTDHYDARRSSGCAGCKGALQYFPFH